MQACETVHAFNARIFGIQRVRYLEFFASPIHHIYIYTVAPIKLHRTARAFFARGDEGCIKFEAETGAEEQFWDEQRDDPWMIIMHVKILH